MATIFGKVLCLIVVCVSILGLGLALFVTIDKREWKKQSDDLNKEIQVRYDARGREEVVLAELARELTVGQRQMAWVYKLQGEKLASLPEFIRVAEARADLDKREKEIQGLVAQVTDRQVENQTLLGQNRDQRLKTETALRDQKSLREEIEAPVVDGKPLKPFRDTIAEGRKDKEAAERDQEVLRPQLVNALVELALVMKRHEQLTKRLEEVKAAGVGAK